MIVAITNHKGGTGKTTTAVNLAAGLRVNGKSVLVIDLDPQGSLSYSFGILDASCDVFDWMLRDAEFEEAAVAVDQIHVLPSSVRYYEREELFNARSAGSNYNLLHDALRHADVHYDFIIIDCPPSFSALTGNALMAADAVIIPTLFEVLPILGIEQILGFIKNVNNEYKRNLRIMGVLGVNVDERRQLTYEVLEYIRDHYDVHVFNNYIRASVKTAEAPSFARSVVDYAPAANSSRDYLAFTSEFLAAAAQKQPSNSTAAV